MGSATYKVRILGGLTGVEFAAVLGRVNHAHPHAALRWSEHGQVCAFVADTWLPILKDRVDRAFDAELGPNWRDKVEEIAT